MRNFWFLKGRFSEAKVFRESKPTHLSSSTSLLFEPYVKEYLTYGGFPEIVLVSDQEEKKVRLENIFTSYFQKEIRPLSDIKKIDLIRDLIILLAQNNSNLLNIERIANDLKVSRLTGEEWLYFLRNTYLIDFVSPFSQNQPVAIKKAKKKFILLIGDWPI